MALCPASLLLAIPWTQEGALQLCRGGWSPGQHEGLCSVIKNENVTRGVSEEDGPQGTGRGEQSGTRVHEKREQLSSGPG